MLGAVSPWAIRLKLEQHRGLGRDGGADVRDLDRRLAARHLPVRAAADPARRHPAHVPRLRARARDRRRRSASGAAGRSCRSASRRCSRSRSARSRRPARGKVIHETDTEYQYARVIDHADGERTLELNEGQAIHSLYRPDTVLTGGYWDGFLVAPFAVRRDPPRRVAMLGFAGGTVARAYARYFPRRAHRRRRDRRRAVRHRPPLLRPAPAAAAARVRRGRAAVPAPDRRPLRRHLPRHLPPALHPVLPVDARVLRARPRRASRPAASSSSTSATRRARTRSRRSSRRRWARPSRTSRATRSSRPTRS